jgi:hypothetical protein
MLLTVDASGAGTAAAAVFVFLLIALFFGSFVFWLVRLAEVCRIPDYQYRAVGTEKSTWVLVVIFAGIVGALVWQFSRRREVLDAYPSESPPGI